MVGGILLVALIFYLWGVVSIGFVSLDKLADTTIPYAMTAKAIMGQKGRILMGIVILSGTCAAVNALFMGVPKMIASMSAQGLLPSVLGAARNRAPIPLILLAIGIGAMMTAWDGRGTGSGGVYQGGYVALAFKLCLIHLCVLSISRGIPDKSKLIQIRGYRFFPIVAFAVLIVILLD